MKNPIALLGTLGLGAGLMYFLDPDRGKRRRALVKDRAAHLSKIANREIYKKGVDLRNRAQGVWFETERLFENDADVTDEQIEARVRTQLGRLSTHPHAVKTSVEDGKLVLSGMILKHEVEPLLKGVAEIDGVREVESQLEAHDSTENIPALQKNKRLAKLEVQKTKWSPKKRLLAAAAGGGLMTLGVKKTTPVNSLLASVGAGLLVRSATNRSLRKLLSSDGDGAIEVHKTINIEAPPERVFEVLKYPQYFPYFMSHVQKVEPVGDKHFRWTVDGIGGYPVSWETEVSKTVPNELIKWKNAGNEINGQSGELRLEPANDGSATRLHIEMNYQPKGGKLGHFVAGLFNRDPKSEMDDDLLRMKTYIEKNKLPRDAAAKINERSNEMKVKEIMTKNPAYATLNTSLHDVAQMMAECDCGCIPVTEKAEDKKPIGMITDRDITLRTIAHNKNPLQMIAGEVMTDNVITITPEASIEDCVAVMEKNQIRRVAVVDEAGNLCGMVAQADVARQAPPFETAELLKDVSMTAQSLAA
jgi:uncharacterized membrane protein